MDPPAPSLARDHLHRCRSRDFRCSRRRPTAGAVGLLSAAAPAVPADVQRAVHVCLAVRSEAAEGAMSGAADIDAKLATLGDWRGATLARLRRLIREAAPDVV